MRVVLATNSSDRGSTSRTLEAWTRLLPGEGIQPIVTVGAAGPLLSALQAGGVRTYVRPIRRTPRVEWPFPFAWAVTRLAAAVVAARASLLHVNEHDHHPVAAAAAALAGVPLVTHLRFRPEPGYARWLFRPGRIPARLFFTSRTQQKDSAPALEGVVPADRWRILPNGLDFSVFGKRTEERERLRQAWGLGTADVALGIACAISPRKRVDHFVRLVAKLRAAGVSAHGFIAGQPHFPEDQAVIDALRRLAVELSIEPYVTFLGYVEPSEPLYHAWDLCISTSKYETFGMAVLEAMACSCAVVTYPGGSVAEIVGEGAVVVPDDDEAALFDRSLVLCRDDDRRRRLGAAGRLHAEATYDIRRIVPTLAREYQDLIAAGRLRR